MIDLGHAWQRGPVPGETFTGRHPAFKAIHVRAEAAPRVGGALPQAADVAFIALDALALA